jgi:predicted ester cyclase
MELKGTAAFKAFHRKLRSEIRDLRVDLEDVLADGDRMAARCLVTGTAAGSGKPVRFPGIAMARWRDGKVVEAWNHFDFHVMQQQLS